MPHMLADDLSADDVADLLDEVRARAASPEAVFMSRHARAQATVRKISDDTTYEAIMEGEDCGVRARLADGRPVLRLQLPWRGGRRARVVVALLGDDGVEVVTVMWHFSEWVIF